MDNLEKIYKEVADELGFSKAKIKSIAESQFLFVSKTMRNKCMDDVRLKYLGIFKVKPARLKYLSDSAKNEIKNKTDEFNSFF